LRSGKSYVMIARRGQLIECICTFINRPRDHIEAPKMSEMNTTGNLAAVTLIDGYDGADGGLIFSADRLSGYPGDAAGLPVLQEEGLPVPQPPRPTVLQRSPGKPAPLSRWGHVTVFLIFRSHAVSKSRVHFNPGSSQFEAIKSLFPVVGFPAGVPRPRKKFDRFSDSEKLRALALAAIAQGRLLTLVSINLDPEETVEHVVKVWNQHRARKGFPKLSYFGVSVSKPHKHAHLMMPIANIGTPEIASDYDFLRRRGDLTEQQLWGRGMGKEKPSAKINLTRVRWSGAYHGLPGALDYLDLNILEGAGEDVEEPQIIASEDLRKIARDIASGKDVPTVADDRPTDSVADDEHAPIITGKDLEELAPIITGKALPVPAECVPPALPVVLRISEDDRLREQFRQFKNDGRFHRAVVYEMDLRRKRQFADGWRLPTRDQAKQRVVREWMGIFVPLAA
jgi:hypothetical protein